MSLKNIFFNLLFSGMFIISKQAYGQYSESKLVIISEDKSGKEIKIVNTLAYMILNLSTGDFTLKADFADGVTGDKILDSLIKNAGQQKMLYSGNIGESILVFNQQQNDEKVYTMTGDFSLNDETFSSNSQFDPLNFAEKSETKNYRMDFKMTLEVSKIHLKGFEGRLTNQAVFEIAGGKLNIQP